MEAGEEEPPPPFPRATVNAKLGAYVWHARYFDRDTSIGVLIVPCCLLAFLLSTVPHYEAHSSTSLGTISLCGLFTSADYHSIHLYLWQNK